MGNNDSCNECSDKERSTSHDAVNREIPVVVMTDRLSLDSIHYSYKPKSTASVHLDMPHFEERLIEQLPVKAHSLGEFLSSNALAVTNLGCPVAGEAEPRTISCLLSDRIRNFTLVDTDAAEVLVGGPELLSERFDITPRKVLSKAETEPILFEGLTARNPCGWTKVYRSHIRPSLDSKLTRLVTSEFTFPGTLPADAVSWGRSVAPAATFFMNLLGQDPCGYVERAASWNGMLVRGGFPAQAVQDFANIYGERATQQTLDDVVKAELIGSVVSQSAEAVDGTICLPDGCPAGQKCDLKVVLNEYTVHSFLTDYYLEPFVFRGSSIRNGERVLSYTFKIVCRLFMDVEVVFTARCGCRALLPGEPGYVQSGDGDDF